MAKSTHRLHLIKLDAEKRLATVIVSTVTKADGAPIVDSQGDIIPISELENAFIEAFAEGGIGKGEEMHERDRSGRVIRGLADVVQHFTLSKSEWAGLGGAMGVALPPMPEVGIAKLRVNDDGLWARVKAGELPEISFTGDALREHV